MDLNTWCIPPLPAPGSPVAVACAAGPSGVPVVQWATAGLPVVVPLSALPLVEQVALASQEGVLPIDRRVALLLAGDRRSAAFALAIRTPRPLGAQGRLELELAAWATTERTRLELPAVRGPVVVVGDDLKGSAAAECRGALNDVYELLAPLPWPRWAGPVVVYRDGVERGIPVAGVIRPALPLVSLRPTPGQADGLQLRGQAAEAFAGLALELSSPPVAGWPRWLQVGVGEAARAVACGVGLSPRAMTAIRVGAGATGITALYAAAEPDPVLAKAVVAELLSPARRANFPSFLDLLRQGASSLGALRVAYRLAPEDLASAIRK